MIRLVGLLVMGITTASLFAVWFTLRAIAVRRRPLVDILAGLVRDGDVEGARRKALSMLVWPYPRMVRESPETAAAILKRNRAALMVAFEAMLGDLTGTEKQLLAELDEAIDGLPLYAQEVQGDTFRRKVLSMEVLRTRALSE